MNVFFHQFFFSRFFLSFHLLTKTPKHENQEREEHIKKIKNSLRQMILITRQKNEIKVNLKIKKKKEINEEQGSTSTSEEEDPLEGETSKKANNRTLRDSVSSRIITSTVLRSSEVLTNPKKSNKVKLGSGIFVSPEKNDFDQKSFFSSTPVNKNTLRPSPTIPKNNSPSLTRGPSSPSIRRPSSPPPRISNIPNPLNNSDQKILPKTARPSTTSRGLNRSSFHSKLSSHETEELFGYLTELSSEKEK